MRDWMCRHRLALPVGATGYCLIDPTTRRARSSVDAVRDILDEQVAYYRAVAAEYHAHAIDVPGKDDVRAGVANFDIRGHVLELTCGQGSWTEHLATAATSLTVVEASPEITFLLRARYSI